MIEDRIKRAKELYLEHKNLFMNDPLIQGYLIKVMDTSISCSIAMDDAGIINTCRICDTEEGGSCCAKGIDERYDETLLLINLLLGIDLPDCRPGKKDCFFLGKDGCSLKARHVLCVNYLCRRAEEEADPEKLMLLRDVEGVLLETIFHLHDRIKRLPHD